MNSNTLQLSQLVDRLWAKTQAGELKWEQLSDRSSYQTRQGDFVISLTGSTATGLGGRSAHLLVKKLDGRIIANVNAGIVNALAGISGEVDRVSPQTEHTLHQLFSYLSDRKSDLDDLLRALN